MPATPPLQILVADPDAEQRSALSSFLEGEGYRVTQLADPRRAPDEIKHGRFQMVFLDLGRPEAAGIEILREIRSDDDDLCVICLTPQASVEGAVETMKLQAFDYLAPPLELARLGQLVRDAIKKHGLLADVEERLNALVGERVRKRRHELGLTLKQLANRTALSVSLISQIELGRSAASVLTVYKLSTALDVKMPYFFQSV